MRVGCHGVYGDRVANYAIQNADLLIVLGSRLDARQVGGNNSLFSRESKKIMVDIDPEEIEKCNERGLRIDLGIVSSVSSFVKQITLDSRPIWFNTLNTWKSEFGTEITREGNVYKYLESIQLPEECIVIPDQGGNLIWTMQSLKLKGKQRLFTNLGNSSMGWSIAASIGAAIATDSKIPIVCIEGDGGIQMNIQELATIKSLNLPITILVLNNTGYGIMRQFQDSYFSSRYTATSAHDVFGNTDGLDFVKIAEAYGIEAKRTDVTPISNDKPILFDVPIVSTQKIFPKLEFGNSLENMTPFRNELHKFMIVHPLKPNIPKGWN
jgi:acetolactate synthase-1/2/3 large subunit